MNDKKPEEVDFNEALRRIAQTPKEAVEKLVNQKVSSYNSKKAARKPPQK